MANGDGPATRYSTADEQPAAFRYAWPMLGAFLLLAVAIGIAAGTSPAISNGGAWYRHGILVGLALEVALAVLFAVLRIIDRRTPRQGYPAAPLRKLLQQVIVATMLVVAAALIISPLHPSAKNHQKPRVKRVLPRGPRKPTLPTSHGPDLAWLPYALLGLLVIIAIVGCVVLILRHRPGRSVRRYDGGVFPDDSEELQRAVDSGRWALRAVDDERAAIIACYLAMEASLARAGTARADAETPDELLQRAAAAGLVHGAAANRLTALFYEARYSTHQLAAGARESASLALDEISADLRGALAHAGPGP